MQDVNHQQYTGAGLNIHICLSFLGANPSSNPIYEAHTAGTCCRVHKNYSPQSLSPEPLAVRQRSEQRQTKQFQVFLVSFGPFMQAKSIHQGFSPRAGGSGLSSGLPAGMYLRGSGHSAMWKLFSEDRPSAT